MNAISYAEQAAILAGCERIDIPFSKLHLSTEYQARKLTVEQRQALPVVQELAASIRTIGLLQNLVVTPASDGFYDVCAGGNRWVAIGINVEAGAFPADYLVQCLVVPAAQAHQASLIENTARAAMHPADVFDGYARLRNEGMGIAAIAAAHGATEAAVKKLLALGDVSPKLMALYRQDKIKIEVMQALASVTDHARQEAAWDAAKNDYYNPAQAIRRLLAENEARGNSAVARYVTVAAYEKAGGAVRRDLFADSDASAVYLEQPDLLHTLALEKMRRSKLFKAVHAEGWGWVDCVLALDEEIRNSFGKVSRTRREPTPKEAEKLAALEQQAEQAAERISEFENSDAEEESADIDAMYEAHTALEEQVRELTDTFFEYPAEFKPHVGVMLHLDYEGNLTATRGLVRREDQEVAQALAKKKNAIEQGGSGGAMLDVPTPKTRPIHSEALVRQLTANKTAIVRAVLCNKPNVALALLAAEFGEQVIGRGYRQSGALKVSMTDATYTVDQAAEDFKGSKAEQEIQLHWQHWTDLMPKNKDGHPLPLLPWLLEQDQQTVVEFLGYCIAASLDGIQYQEPTSQTALDRVAALVDVNPADWWEPTSVSYLGRVSKDQIAVVVGQVAGQEAAAPLAKMKKGEAAALAEKILAGKRWLPDALAVKQLKTDA